MNNFKHSGCPAGAPGEEGMPSTNGIPEEWLQGSTADKKRELDILGVIYTVEEVEVVNKTEPRRGEINFLTNEIRIDKNMPTSLKEQVLMHEVLHATFDLLGFSELAENEEKVQSIATALHQIFTSQTIFSF